jgi:hypothetical protein
VLKMGTAEAELDQSIEDIVLKFFGKRCRDVWLWRQICEAELRMYRLLDFRVAVPCVADLHSRITLGIAEAAMKAGTCAGWPGLGLAPLRLGSEMFFTPRFVALSAFLIELGLAHAERTMYGARSPPALFAFAAAHLSTHSFGDVPLACKQAYSEAEKECEVDAEASSLLAAALLNLWRDPPSNCAVMRKWSFRQERQLINLPPPPKSYPFALPGMPSSTPKPVTHPYNAASKPNPSTAHDADAHPQLHEASSAQTNPAAHPQLAVPKRTSHPQSRATQLHPSTVHDARAHEQSHKSKSASTNRAVCPESTMPKPAAKVKAKAKGHAQRRDRCRYCGEPVPSSHMAGHVRNLHGEGLVAKRGGRRR